MIWRPRSSSAACAGVAAASTLVERGAQGAVEVAAAQERQHVVLEDRLALAVAQERGLEPRAGVQLDLAVPAGLVDVEEDDQAVVEALAADVPLVHERPRPRLGLIRARRAAQQLAEDHDLCAGPRLDPVDDRFGVDDRVGREEAGIVVDGPVGLRVREGRPGWRGVLGRRLAGSRVGARRRRQGALGDLRQARERRAVEVAGGQRRQHHVVEDRLPFVRREVCRVEAGAGVELHLAVLAGAVEVVEDDEAVIDAAPTHAPLVHERLGVRLGLVRGDLVAAGVLRVEDDLGLGLGLDRVDDPLGRLLGLGPDDAGVVVDGLSVDGVGVGRAGRRRARGAREAGDDEGEERDGRQDRETTHRAQDRRAGRPRVAPRRQTVDDVIAGLVAARIRRTSSAACSYRPKLGMTYVPATSVARPAPAGRG